MRRRLRLTHTHSHTGPDQMCVFFQRRRQHLNYICSSISPCMNECILLISRRRGIPTAAAARRRQVGGVGVSTASSRLDAAGASGGRNSCSDCAPTAEIVVGSSEICVVCVVVGVAKE